jgi:predicted protein tyrosine phosphatase
MSLKAANNEIKNNPEKRSNWISIRERDFPELYDEIDRLCKNICKVEFDDVTHYDEKHDLIHQFFKEVKKHRDLIHFNEIHAKQIFEFATKIYKLNEPLNIHCYAGHSRSQAIGYVLNVYFNLIKTHNLTDFNRNLQNNNLAFRGNSDVIKIMNEEIMKHV